MNIKEYKDSFQVGTSVYYTYINHSAETSIAIAGIYKIRDRDEYDIELSNGHTAIWNGSRWIIPDIAHAYLEIAPKELLA